jgi:hypothetical protein
LIFAEGYPEFLIRLSANDHKAELQQNKTNTHIRLLADQRVREFSVNLGSAI